MPDCGEPGLYLFNSRLNRVPGGPVLSLLPLPVSLHLVSSRPRVHRDVTESQAIGRF